MKAVVRRVALGVVVVVIVVGGIVGGLAAAGSASTNTLTAYFKTTIGVYVGNSVDVMGVKIGEIKSLTVEGGKVKAVIDYDSSQKLPANVKAVLIAPSVVSDRYISLQPVYKSGPTLANNATLAEKDTAIPLEFDDIFKNLDQLNRALGPKGANKNGALSRLIAIGDKNLHGHGAELHSALSHFSAAIATLSGSRGNLFGTVSHLQQFTATLDADDGGVRALNKNLASVGNQLNNERHNLAAALSNLSSALRLVNTFVASNRVALTTDLHGATKVSQDLQVEKRALIQLLNDAPLAVSNLALAGDPEAHTLDTRASLTYTASPGELCSSLLNVLNGAGLGAVTGVTSGACKSVASAAASTNAPGSTRTTPASGDGLGQLLGLGGK